MTIRRATLADIPALEDLLEQVLEVHHQARPDLFKAKGKKFSRLELENLIADDQRPVFVYEDDQGQVLGHLFMILEQSNSAINQDYRTLFIDDLCISAKARGQHLGQQLMDFARAYAREQGCYNLRLHVWNANEGALGFYKHQGLQEQFTTMEEIL